ncbi:TRAP transporter substrate-binding protein DctP [Chloroflexota bacterium]
MRKFLCSVLLITLVAVVLGCAAPAPEAPAPAAPAPAKTITLTMVSFGPKTASDSATVVRVAEKLQNLSRGELIIDYKGGPEVIPTFEQMEACKTGVVDLVQTGMAYMVGFAPEFMYGTAAGVYDRPAEREMGIFDAWDRVCQQYVNTKFLAQQNGGKYAPMTIFSNRKVEKLADLKGQRVRGAPHYLPFLDKLGVEMITMPFGEMYEAMERSVIDGFCFPVTAGPVSIFKMNEVAKYVVLPETGFVYQDAMWMMNLDKWNELPEHLQTLLSEVGEDSEYWSYYLHTTNLEKEMKLFEETGVEVCNLSPDEKKWWIENVRLAYLEHMKENLSPESYATLSPMLIPK